MGPLSYVSDSTARNASAARAPPGARCRASNTEPPTWPCCHSQLTITADSGNRSKCRRFPDCGVGVAGGVSMFSNSSRLESANWELPHSSWAIPVVTGLVVLLAVTSALA